MRETPEITVSCDVIQGHPELVGGEEEEEVGEGRGEVTQTRCSEPVSGERAWGDGQAVAPFWMALCAESRTSNLTMKVKEEERIRFASERHRTRHWAGGGVWGKGCAWGDCYHSLGRAEGLQQEMRHSGSVVPEGLRHSPGFVAIEIGSGWCKGNGALLEDYQGTHRINEEAGEARSENDQGPKAARMRTARPPLGAQGLQSSSRGIPPMRMWPNTKS